MVFKHTAISLGLVMALTNTTSVLAEEFEKNSDVIVVTGSRIDQKLSDVAGSVNVVTEQDIDNELAVDLSSAFRYQTGISATGNAGQAQALNIRGMGGNRVVYVKDGRRLNDAYQGGNGLLIGRGYLDIEGIRQIEVAKGAASSLYGSDALGGIVVISSKSPEDYLAGQSYFASIQAGFNGLSDETSLTGTFAKRFGDNATSVVLTRRDGEETQNYVEDLPGFDYDSNAVVLKSQQRLNNTDSLLATVDYFEQQTNQVVSKASQETVDENTSLSFSLGYNSKAATFLYDNLDAQIYLTDFEQKSAQIRAGNGRTGAYVDNNDYRFEQQIWGAKLLLDKKLMTGSFAQQLVYGFDFERYDTTRPRFKTRLDATGQTLFANQPQKAFPGADTNMLGIFAQTNMTLVDELLELQMAVRWDHYDMQAKDSTLYTDADFKDIDKTAFSPKVGLVYSVNSNLHAYVQYAEGFKIPPHDQAYQSHGVEPFYQILPNADLDPEYSQGIELGLKGDFDNHQFVLSLFNTEFDGFIASKVVKTQPTQIPRVNKVYYQYQNLSDVEIKGVEASYTLWLNDRFAIDTGITYLDGKDTVANQYIESISPLNGYVKARYEFGDLSVTAAIRGAKNMDKVPSESMVQTSGWGTTDLFAHYQIGKWQINGGVFNVFDKEYVSYQDVAGQDKNTSLSQYTQPGRHIAAKLKYIF
ncbi:TonB-dependent receptor domain-containing protein [Pseudoalteromonas sp. S16_S37]|uniref:TonB-dependent receptor domain-containing protein n=1 Tax=Pseudoalteromonas sp. S16_S37 TaxID=2720228 RepID=UPI0016802776|nr:TonB-dependent receptor [Pseudoalteromonas sp. S16_S37]MBD1583389.1 TonB-dependent receptor [Pseudoalteromonas sp. S16_S37]